MPRQYNSRENLKPELASIKDLAESHELQSYYQKMAEDYRCKYLAIERDYNMLKHTLEYENQVKDQEYQSTVAKL